MSATNRGGVRRPADFYPTPHWCVHRLLEAFHFPSGVWLDPAAGNGDIIDAVNDQRSHITWDAIELREECREVLAPKVNGRLLFGDALQLLDEAPRPDVIMTNPPFKKAMEFVEACVGQAEFTAILLRLNMLASASRASFMRLCPPDVYVLPNRPSFVAGRTDNTEYAWFVWPSGGVPRGEGVLRVLRTTPISERRVARETAA